MKILIFIKIHNNNKLTRIRFHYDCKDFIPWLLDTRGGVGLPNAMEPLFRCHVLRVCAGRESIICFDLTYVYKIHATYTKCSHSYVDCGMISYALLVLSVWLSSYNVFHGSIQQRAYILISLKHHQRQHQRQQQRPSVSLNRPLWPCMYIGASGGGRSTEAWASVCFRYAHIHAMDWVGYSIRIRTLSPPPLSMWKAMNGGLLWGSAATKYEIHQQTVNGTDMTQPFCSAAETERHGYGWMCPLIHVFREREVVKCRIQRQQQEHKKQSNGQTKKKRCFR